MRTSCSYDSLVKARLRDWPQHPPGLSPNGRNAWLRGRPTYDTVPSLPFLKTPGSEALRTLPDGLWLNFGGTPAEPFVDIFAIEACATQSNLLDKRSRFAPSVHSLLAVCPVPWLLAQAMPDDPTPRWKATRVIRREPATPFIAPVRDMRVLYALRDEHFEGFRRNQVPHAHEYFTRMGALVANNSDKDPALQTMLSRATSSANFIVDAA